MTFLKNALMLPLSGLMLMGLSACSNRVNSDAGLTVVEYSPSVQKKAAAELRACEAPTVLSFMADYHVLREQAKIK